MTVELCLELLKRFIIVLFGIGSIAPPSPALVAETQDIFSKRLQLPVTPEEAKEIIRSFANFVILIKEVHHAGAKQRGRVRSGLDRATG